MRERMAMVAQHAAVSGDLHKAYTGPRRLSALSAREQQIFHQMQGDNKKFYKDMTGPVPKAKSIMLGELRNHNYQSLNNLTENDLLNILTLRFHHIPPINTSRHSQSSYPQTKFVTDIGTKLYPPANWQELRDSFQPLQAMTAIVYGQEFATETFSWLDRRMVHWREAGASFTLAYFWYCSVLLDWSHTTDRWAESGAATERPMVWEYSALVHKFEGRIQQMATASTADFLTCDSS